MPSATRRQPRPQRRAIIRSSVESPVEQLANLPPDLRQRVLDGLSPAQLTALAELAQVELLELGQATVGDPVVWAERVLGVACWPRQAEFMRAVATHPKVAVRSGHKVGKTTGCASLALWWCADPVRRPGARVVATSASWTQLTKQLWREIVQLYGAAEQRGFDLTAAVVNRTPEAGILWKDGREIVGFSTKEGRNAAGWSGAHLLFICDEASGIGDEVYEALEGNRAAGTTHILLTGNPTHCAGRFYEVFRRNLVGWIRLRISSLEAAKWQAEQGRVIPGMASLGYIEEMRGEWEGGPQWAVRIAGEFPEQGQHAVIPLGLVESAQARFAAGDGGDGPLRIGVDVGREHGGDDSVIAVRRWLRVLELREFRGLDGPELAAEVVRAVLDHRAERDTGDWLPVVFVDAIGVGASCFDALAHTARAAETPLLSAYPIDVKAAPTVRGPAGNPLFERLRDQLWFAAVDWLKAGLALPPHERLAAELVGASWMPTARGAQKVASKPELRQVLGRSPDRADAVLLSLLEPPAQASARAAGMSDAAQWWG